MIEQLLSQFTWYRKIKGGVWHYNRYWFDAGVNCIFVWERQKLSKGGPRATLKTEHYLPNGNVVYENYE